jgi:hypothetical protein
LSGFSSFGGLGDGHKKQSKPITPNKMMGIKYSKLMSPPRSIETPPTSPDHENLDSNGRELDMRATKNDKVATEKSTIPSLRRLMLI